VNIIPLDDRIIVRRVASDAARAPRGAAMLDMPEWGVVIAVGTGMQQCDGAMRRAIAAGDTISFCRDAAQEITFAGMQYWIMKAEQVLAIESSAADPLRSHRA
jgi:co-chaperonin GroES (HSP10)